MKIKKMLTYEIKYVDCNFEIEDISKCRINGISSSAQTIKNLPFLKYKQSGFEWNPRILIETGQIVCWPKGIRAVINFELRSHFCNYLTDTYAPIFSNDEKIPDYLQLDLVDNSQALNFTINGDGYIENWPDVQDIMKQLL